MIDAKPLLSEQTIETPHGVFGWGMVPPLEVALVSLGRLARFAGHTRQWWTVLQHSYGCYLIARAWHDLAPELRETYPHLPIQCLLHDWAETLTSDVPTPFKPAEWKPLERAFAERAAWTYRLPLPVHWGADAWAAVHEVDVAAYNAERVVVAGGAHRIGSPDGPAVHEVDAVRRALLVQHSPAGSALQEVVRRIIQDEARNTP